MKVTEQTTASSHHSEPDLVENRSGSTEGNPRVWIWNPGDSGSAKTKLGGTRMQLEGVYTDLDISDSSIPGAVDALVLECGSETATFQTCMRRIRKVRSLDQVPVIAFLEDPNDTPPLDDIDEILFAEADTEELGLRISHIVQTFRKKMRSGSIEVYKRNLVEAIAHDVRSPLHTVSFALDLILESAEKENSRWVKMIHAAKESTGQITDIMDMMVSIQRLEESGGNLALADVDVADIMSQVASSLDTPDNLTVCVSAGTIVRADLNLAVRAVAKVIKNCLHYVPMGEGKVEVSVEIEGGGLTILIEENSKPFPDHFLDQVFEMFARVPEEGGKPGRSFGLDFAYSRAAMLGQGGSLKVVKSDTGNVFQATFAIPA